MLARLRRMSIVTRILAVATLSLVVLSGTLFVVVKQTVETTTFDQTRAEVIHAEGMLHYLADQKGSPAIVDGQLVFGRLPIGNDVKSPVAKTTQHIMKHVGQARIILNNCY